MFVNLWKFKRPKIIELKTIIRKSLNLVKTNIRKAKMLKIVIKILEKH
jgi:hypothetical protein